ncbi:hypothetical protein U1Q18_007429 [Sarracenia purpurea var. burkii]
MGKGGRQWLRPGDLSEYERERISRIKENNDKLNSLQLKNTAPSVFGSVQLEHASEKGKRERVDLPANYYVKNINLETVEYHTHIYIYDHTFDRGNGAQCVWEREEDVGHRAYEKEGRQMKKYSQWLRMSEVIEVVSLA